MHPSRLPARRRWLGALALLAALGACGASQPAAGAGHRSATAPTRAPASAAPGGGGSTAALQSAQPGWTVVSRVGGAVAVDERSWALPDGSHGVVVRFHAGLTHFALHVGSTDPPNAVSKVPASAGPAISPAEAPALLAAFNGGFQVSTGSGGVEVDGTVLAPLVNGDASFVIDTNGTGHVGVWGQDMPAAGEQVASVRQNLPPLLLGGRPPADIGNVPAWGLTLGGGSVVARSAVAQDAQGNILYAGSMAAVPRDLATALASSGAQTAMQLDINPEWVQLALAAAPGGPLRTGVPGQHRPANQYQVGWTRDFFTVLAGP